MKLFNESKSGFGDFIVDIYSHPIKNFVYTITITFCAGVIVACLLGLIR